MTKKNIISTENAPAAIGTYSQAVKVGSTVYISGQIPLDPVTMSLVADTFPEQCERVFDNLAAVAQAAGGSLQDIVKLSIFLVDLRNFATVNEIMARHFTEPYPARAAIGVAALPKDAQVEIEAIMDIAER
jgi:reactive intermediate/imine deaminase